jgi:hypothetical protein
MVPEAPIADAGRDPEVDLDTVPRQRHHPGSAAFAEPVPTAHWLGASTAHLSEHQISLP